GEFCEMVAPTVGGHGRLFLHDAVSAEQSIAGDHAALRDRVAGVLRDLDRVLVSLEARAEHLFSVKRQRPGPRARSIAPTNATIANTCPTQNRNDHLSSSNRSFAIASRKEANPSCMSPFSSVRNPASSTCSAELSCASASRNFAPCCA